ncbi:MAG TPA: TlyA family RNA methyltransferase [Candidatus Polarisedimenticolia bacterium]|jgi:23S rRNA (cytidine1920-2'-O)/16S rRNA (cytidine1409-2'-O)-methyltransferase
MTRRRLDQVLVERGLAPSRQAAQALIMSGRVQVEGRTLEKPGTQVDPLVGVSVAGPALPYVGRGGVKLAGALDAFGLDVTGLAALDVGSSTGGFTDCLLQRGAARVVCVDVGHGQLDWKLRNDPRVTVLEGINARYLSPAELPEGWRPELAVIDVSFISLKLVLPRIAPLVGFEADRAPAGARGSIVALVKPQFEVGRGNVGRGGIVRGRSLRAGALTGIASFALSMGLSVRAMIRSPISGAEGNIEYFVLLDSRTGGFKAEEIDENALTLTQEEPE